MRNVARAATGVGTGGNSHEAHTHRDGGGVIDRRTDRIGANNAAGDTTVLIVNDTEHDSNDAGHTRNAAINDDVTKHDEHDANAGRGIANNDDEQQYDDDRAGRLPHAEGSGRALRMSLRSDPHRHVNRGRGEWPQHLCTSGLTNRLFSLQKPVASLF